MFALTTTMIIPLLVAIYTINYGRWAWRQQMHRGAIGLYLIAAATLLVPGAAFWWLK